MRTVIASVTAVLLLGGGRLRADEDAAAIVRKAIKAALPLIGAKYGGFRSFRPVRLG